MAAAAVVTRRLLLPLLFLLLAGCLAPTHTAQAAEQAVGDRWPQFEVPSIPEDKDGTQIRLSRIRDGYLAVNTKTDASTTAELLIGDYLATKGFSDEQVFAVQEVVGLLVKAGVVEVHAEKFAAATGQAPASRRHLRSSSTVARNAPPAAAAQDDRRALQGCCPCVEPAMGHHPKPPSSPHYSLHDKQQQQPPSPPTQALAAPQTRSEKASMYKSMKALGLALRRAAAARSFYLYLTDDLDVHSYEEFESLSAGEQEATRAEVVGQLLVTCRQYGLTGAELQVGAACFIGVGGVGCVH